MTAAEKLENRHIPATVRSIAVKFGVVAHFDPLDPFDAKKFRFLKISKIQDGSGCRHEKIEKLPYLSNGLTDSSNALWPSWSVAPLKFPHFENPRWWRPPFWKIEKSSYLTSGLIDRREIWRGDTFCSSGRLRPLKIRNFKNPRWQRWLWQKIENRHILLTVWPITAKFGTVTHWHVDAYLPYRQLNIQPFKNPTWCTAAVLTIKKSWYVDKGLTNQDYLMWRILAPTNLIIH